MQIRKLFVALLVCASVPAAADFVTIVKAHEVAVADLRLPGNTGGTLSFKACGDCDYQTVRVTSATQYEANNRSYTLEDFRKELERIDNPRNVHVTVMQHLESNTITAIRANF